VLGERCSPGQVQVPGQPAHPGQHVQWRDVEIRALALPGPDDPVDLVLLPLPGRHPESLDAIKFLDINLLDRQAGRVS
jgi:hypothetical protein